jgi:hypothetical protein
MKDESMGVGEGDYMRVECTAGSPLECKHYNKGPSQPYASRIRPRGRIKRCVPIRHIHVPLITEWQDWEGILRLRGVLGEWYVFFCNSPAVK